MEEYGIMEYLELAVTRCGRWTGNREFIWSGLTIKKVCMIITMLHDLHSYSYIVLAMYSRPLDSILATEMIILLHVLTVIYNHIKSVTFRGDSRDFAEWFPKKIMDHSV